jgi:hypothetical protein
VITIDKKRTRLSGDESWSRLAFIVGIGLCAALLKMLDPLTAQRWLPLSCGAVTGVPCIFCGTTRAVHYLLNGDFSRAVYFNWIAFPLAALVLSAIAISACEVVAQTRFIRFATVRVTPRAIGIALAALSLVWGFQVWLAISQHKTELLNSHGPLYALLVR